MSFLVSSIFLGNEQEKFNFDIMYLKSNYFRLFLGELRTQKKTFDNKMTFISVLISKKDLPILKECVACSVGK